MAGRGGTVTVIFLGDAAQLDDTLAHVTAATDATADAVGDAGTKAGSKFSEGLDKGTSKLSSLFSSLGSQMSNFGLPFSGEMSKIGNELGDVETKGKGFKDAMSSFGAVGVAALAGVALESVHLADSFDKTQAALETAVKNSGASWSQYKGQVADAAKSSGALVTGNASEVDDALQELTTATRSPSTALKDMADVENIAAMKHISLADAAEGLVKVYGGSTRILEQWGINLDVGSDKLKSIQSAEEAVQNATLSYNTAQAEVSDGQLQGVAASSKLASASNTLKDAQLNLKESQQALPDIMDQIASRTKGAASALGDTLAGKITIAKNAVTNLGISFGEMLLPAVDKVISVFAGVAGFFERNKAAAEALAVVIGVPLVASMLLFAEKATVSALGAVGKLITSLTSLGATTLKTVTLQNTEAKQLAAQQVASNDIVLASQKQLQTSEELIASVTSEMNAEQEIGYEALTAVAAESSEEQRAALLAVMATAQTSSTEIVAANAKTGVSSAALAKSQQANAELFEVADTGMLTSAETTSKGIMAALGSSGVGLAVVALGVAITELMTHWGTAWNAMKDAVTTAANASINVINAITGAIHTLTAGLVSIPKMTHITISETTTTSTQATDKNSQGLFTVGGGKNWNVPTTALPSGTTQAQDNTIQKLINDGDTLDQALKKVGISAAAVADANMSSAQAAYKAAVIAEAGLTGTALAAQKAQATLDKLQAEGASKGAIAQAQNALTIAQAKEQASGQTQTPGSTIPKTTGTTSVSGGAGSTTLTAGEAAMEKVANAFAGKLKLAGMGGTGITEQAATVAEITAALSANQAQEQALVKSLAASPNPSVANMANTITGDWKSLTTKLAGIIDTDTKSGQSEVQKLQSAQSSTSIDTLRSAVTGQAQTSFNELISQLTGVHSKALNGLVASLKANWATTTSDYTQVMGTLSTIAQADAAEMTAQVGSLTGSTVAAVQTSISQAMASNGSNPAIGSLGTTYLADQASAQQQLGSLMGATATQVAAAISQATANGGTTNTLGSLGTQAVVDQINNNATQINDSTKVTADKSAQMVDAINAQTTATTDAANAQISSIQDATQTQVDVLGERGLYGLQLVAQQAKVVLDQQKAIDDANIATAQAHLDQITAQNTAKVAAAQTKADQVQATQDANVAATQATADAAAINGAIQAAAAQAGVDAQGIVNAINVQTATAHADATQYSTSNVQAAAQAAEKLAQSNADSSAAQMAAQQQVTTNAINAANQNAQNAYNQASAYATQQEALANQTLSNAQNNANVQDALAQQNLSSIQSQAQVTEAKLTSIVNVDQELAATEFSGSGVTIYVSSAAPSDEAAITAAGSYLYRYKAS